MIEMYIFSFSFGWEETAYRPPFFACLRLPPTNPPTHQPTPHPTNYTGVVCSNFFPSFGRTAESPADVCAEPCVLIAVLVIPISYSFVCKLLNALAMAFRSLESMLI